MCTIIVRTIVLLLFISVAQGEEQKFTQRRLSKLLKSKIESIKELASNKIIIKSVLEQNQKNMLLEDIKIIDNEWVSSKVLTDFKKSLQENVIGKYFKAMIDFNKSIYSEAFLTDNQGANVATYPVTSDYWQGDEDKWIKSYNNAKGKVFVGRLEFDESTKTNAIQISVPVINNKKTIGVLIVGVKLTYLQTLYLKSK